MGFTLQKNDQKNDEKNDRQTEMLHTLAAALRKAIKDDELNLIEVERKAGRAGYKTTGLTWNTPEPKVDDATALAQEILDEVRVDMEDNGPEYYQVLGFADAPRSKEGIRQVFKYAISKQAFPGLDAYSSVGDDAKSEVIAALAQMRGQNSDLHKVLLKAIEAPIKALEKAGDLIGKYGEAEGNRNNDIETLKTLLEFMKEQRDDELDYRARENRRDRNAEMFATALKTFGPDAIDWLREVLSQMGVSKETIDATVSQAKASTDDAKAKARARREKRDLRYRDRLRRQLDDLDDSVAATARDLVGEREWDLLVASAHAENHGDFYGRISSLVDLLQSRGKEAGMALMAQLGTVLPPESMVLLRNLFEMAKEPL